jgi:VPDSG-CTERM motif
MGDYFCSTEERQELEETLRAMRKADSRTKPILITMKTLLALITLALVTSVHAHLIGLGPNGVYELAGKFAGNHISFADRFDHDLGFEHIGDLDGGISFTLALINQGTSALISWDFAGSLLRMRYIDLIGFNGDQLVENVYRVSGPEWASSDGFQVATIDGTTSIQLVDFYFSGPLNNVPDGGSTIALMGLGLVGVFMLRRRYA